MQYLLLALALVVFVHRRELAAGPLRTPRVAYHLFYMVIGGYMILLAPMWALPLILPPTACSTVICIYEVVNYPSKG